MIIFNNNYHKNIAIVTKHVVVLVNSLAFIKHRKFYSSERPVTMYLIDSHRVKGFFSLIMDEIALSKELIQTNDDFKMLQECKDISIIDYIFHSYFEIEGYNPDRVHIINTTRAIVNGHFQKLITCIKNQDDEGLINNPYYDIYDHIVLLLEQKFGEIE